MNDKIKLEDLTKPNTARKEKRTEKISVFLTPKEKKDIIKLSKKYGLKMSSYLRFKGISDFIIGRGRGIERIKQEKRDQDPIMVEMKKGFTHVVNEIRKGFKEGRKFLKPIPIKDRIEIMKHKQERMKKLKVETLKCDECKNLFEIKALIQIERYKNTQVIKSKVCPECFEIIKEKEFIKLI